MEKYDDYAVANFESLKKMSDEYKQGVDILQEERREERREEQREERQDRQEERQEDRKNIQLPKSEPNQNGEDTISKRVKKTNPTFNLFLFALIVDLISNR